jgi:hypothetical protein
MSLDYYRLLEAKENNQCKGIFVNLCTDEEYI